MSEKRGPSTGLTRRSFLKTTAVAAGAATLAGGASLTALADDTPQDSTSEEQVYQCVCRSNCSASCLLDAHVRDGMLTKLTPTVLDEDLYTGGCLKGLSYVERMYHSKRIKYPMRRVGERGEDQWERISWDEAIQEAADKLTEIINTYGGTAVVIDVGSGCYGALNGGAFGILKRFGCCIGATIPVFSQDYAIDYGIGRALKTSCFTHSNAPDVVLDSSMCIVWGANPVHTAPQNWRFIQRAKENGCKVVTIDIMRSATAYKSDEFVQVDPGYDGYLALAMANHIVQSGLADEQFLKTKTTGPFLVRKDTGKHLRLSDKAVGAAGAISQYQPSDGSGVETADAFYVWDAAVNAPVLQADAVKPVLEGSFVTKDGIKVETAYSLLKKRLEEYPVSLASELCGVPEDRITELAEEIAAQRAVSCHATYGIDHYANGYQSAWAVAILMAVTGNLCEAGTGFVGCYNQPYMANPLPLWFTEEFKGFNFFIPFVEMHNVWRDQALEGKPYPVKAMISSSTNPLNNYPSQNDWFNEVLPNMEYWIFMDSSMCDSARYADLLLPIAMWYEEDDLRTTYNGIHTVLQEKAVDPPYECRTEADIVSALGRAMGLKSFPEGMTMEDWLGPCIDNDGSRALGVTFDNLREKKHVVTTFSKEPDGHFVFGRDAALLSESGLVELYCEDPTPRLDFGQDLSAEYENEHLVYMCPPAEVNKDNPLREKYPLVYLQLHNRYRVHTQWWEVPTLKELEPEPTACVSSIDAAARGVKDGDYIEVFNDRGHAVVRCVIDESMPAGIVNVPKGWQRNQYKSGCYQELTNNVSNKWVSGFCFYDTLVDFKKAEV